MEFDFEVMSASRQRLRTSSGIQPEESGASDRVSNG